MNASTSEDSSIGSFSWIDTNESTLSPQIVSRKARESYHQDHDTRSSVTPDQSLPRGRQSSDTKAHASKTMSSGLPHHVVSPDSVFDYHDCFNETILPHPCRGRGRRREQQQQQQRLLVIDDSEESENTYYSTTPLRATSTFTSTKLNSSKARKSPTEESKNSRHNTSNRYYTPNSKNSTDKTPTTNIQSSTSTNTGTIRIRTVSPDPPSTQFYNEKFSSSSAPTRSISSETVFIASSMRGKCYHSNQSCHGLRSAHGVCSISQQGALLRGMRACELCTSQSRQPQVRQHQRSVNSTNTKLDKQSLFKSQSSQSKEQKHRTSNTKNNSNDHDDTVMVHAASSLKGKCYHTSSSCKGLRNAIGGSVKVTKKNALKMNMRPCKLCCEEVISEHIASPSMQESDDSSLSLKGRSSSCHGTTETVNAPLSKLYNSDQEIKSNIQRRSYTTMSTNSRPAFYTTTTGKCYHSSKTCSSLRRSKNVKEQIEKPYDKRPCKLCCT